jgi:hypothetical protein
MAPKTQRKAAAKKPVEIVPESPKEEVIDAPMMDSPSPVTVAEVEVKIPDAPKKRGRKAKNSDDEAPKEKTPEPKNDDEEVKVEAPKKRGRKPKNSDDEANEKPKKERKPRTKKVAEDKKTDDEANDKPKKERKPRAKTEYNIFIGEKMKELREKHKDDTEKLKTTEYMKMAIAEWKLHKEAKNTVEVA